MMYELDAVPEVAAIPAAFVRNTISATFNAAFSTAYSSMGSFVALCLERPGLAGRIVATGDVSRGVKELLRFTSPAQLTARYAIRDVDIGSANIRQNDPVITLLAAANRDPAVFASPDDLVLERSPNPHLSFGHGSHRCVGTKPAEEFLSRFIEHLAHWEKQLALAADPAWLDTATLRCLATLPVCCLDRR
jgi:cytochrome P450